MRSVRQGTFDPAKGLQQSYSPDLGLAEEIPLAEK
jgi:hypothetical protein